jgi:hypothetical protein
MSSRRARRSTAPSPGGLVCWDEGVRFIPLTSLRATTRLPRAQSWARSGGSCVVGCAPGSRAVGRCQRDEARSAGLPTGEVERRRSPWVAESDQRAAESLTYTMSNPGVQTAAAASAATSCFCDPRPTQRNPCPGRDSRRHLRPGSHRPKLRPLLDRQLHPPSQHQDQLDQRKAM